MPSCLHPGLASRCVDSLRKVPQSALPAAATRAIRMMDPCRNVQGHVVIARKHTQFPRVLSPWGVIDQGYSSQAILRPRHRPTFNAPPTKTIGRIQPPCQVADWLKASLTPPPCTGPHRPSPEPLSCLAAPHWHRGPSGRVVRRGAPHVRGGWGGDHAEPRLVPHLHGRRGSPVDRPSRQAGANKAPTHLSNN